MSGSCACDPSEMIVEQINAKEETYLHHDQQGSTRLLTGSAGTVTGKCTYSAYGTPTCEGTTTTPLGYDAQYTSTDTGLIYMRACTYDPATAQFLSVDPLVAITRAPYSYAFDNPLIFNDPTGLESLVEDFTGTIEEIPHTIASGEAGRFLWNEAQGFLGGLVGANTSCLGAGAGFGVFLASGETEGLGGDFSTFTRNPSGQIDHYITFSPNPRNPSGYEPVKLFDRVGRGHYNKIYNAVVETLHVHENDAPGGVRPAEPDEIPIEIP